MGMSNQITQKSVLLALLEIPRVGHDVAMSPKNKNSGSQRQGSRDRVLNMVVILFELTLTNTKNVFK